MENDTTPIHNHPNIWEIHIPYRPIKLYLGYRKYSKKVQRTVAVCMGSITRFPLNYPSRHAEPPPDNKSSLVSFD